MIIQYNKIPCIHEKSCFQRVFKAMGKHLQYNVILKNCFNVMQFLKIDYKTSKYVEKINKRKYGKC